MPQGERAGPCQGDPPPTVDHDAKTLASASAEFDSAVVSSDGNDLAENRSRKCFGDYELLEEVARGGMGVVFRARDRRLNRVVALKMVLSGRFATEVDLRRFHVEAEAAARLDHPGIVPIYEIGEWEGQHFFTMKFVSGGSLAGRLAQLRSDPRAAVALIAKVARAVSHAHQRGILHRDLKPANILIDDAGEPLVSDLGLAKSVAGDSKLTQSGTIVGTPSYMSPEQAAGTADVTTAADIYSLGAIVYEALTGRPPHQAATPLDTLLEVLNDDPAQPHSIDPSVDRGLEQVAMKCLARSPSDRYSSAAALADDLERWLAGEPISVRPASAATAAQLWVRRNLRSAVGAVVVGLLAGVICGVTFWLTAIGPRLADAKIVYDSFPSEPRPLGAFGLRTPTWVSYLTFLWLTCLLMFVGLVNVAVVRPVRRPGWIASGVICGLSVALGSYAVSFGWGPITLQAISPSYDDLSLMSRALFVESDADAQRLRRSIERRHPDLKHMYPGSRASFLASKVVLDEMAGVPAGLWVGIAVSLIAGMVPAVCGTLLAGSLLEQRRSLARVLGPYAEIMGSATSFCVIGVAYWFSEIAGSLFAPPPMEFQVPFFAGLGLACFAALRQWRIPLRLLVSSIWVVALVFMIVFFVRSGRASDAARDLVAGGKLDEAAGLLESYLRHHPNDAYAGLCAGVLRLKLGDVERYRARCRTMLTQFQSTRAPADADKAAKLCLIIADAMPEAAPARDLAELALDEGYQTPYETWFLLVRGLAALRSGEFEQAITWLRQCQESPEAIRSPTARLIESMALAGLGRNEDARTEFNEATSAFEVYQAEAPTAELSQRWVDVMIFELLRAQTH
jgi:hypothetical protein